DEAAGLVIQAGALVSGGDLFVLDMGAPVSILELAHNMIKLRGLRQAEDIAIEFTGLRPGEKLHEKLFFEEEIVSGTDHPRVSKVVGGLEVPSLLELQPAIGRLARCAEMQNVEAAVGTLKALVDLKGAEANRLHSVVG